MTVNEALAATLRACGVTDVFGVMGDANMYVVERFVTGHGGRFVSASNEGGAVLMAAGYAAVSGRAGVATVTHGALTNCLSALFDASRGRYPVLLIAGDTARADAYNLQNIPQAEVVAPARVGYVEVRSADTAAVDLARALRQATAQRRPVVLDLPADLQQATCDPAPVRLPGIRPASCAPAGEDLETAAGMLIGSRRPLVLAGRGAASDGAAPALRRLAERIGAPLVTTLRGKGLFTGDAFDLGICGTLANPVASATVADSDCLLVFGASLSALTTMKGEFLAGKRVIQVDTDPGAIGRYYHVDLGVLGDAGACAEGLRRLVEEAETPPSGFRSGDLARAIKEFRSGDTRGADDLGGPLDISGVLHRIDAIVPAGRSLTVDGGRFSHEALRILSVDRPGNYAHCLNVGHIGMSVGYGIGAAAARPDEVSLVVAGDGGFMLGGLAEFNTAVRHRLSLVVVVLNDGAYGAEYYRFATQDLDPKPTTFDWPDLAEVATALGGTGVTVRHWADLGSVRTQLRDLRGPLLVDVHLDPATIPDPGVH